MPTNRTTLKTYFETGDIPNQTQFAAEIDASVNIEDDMPNSFFSSETGITAYAGGGQANAYLITKKYNEIAICTTSGDSVKLPPALIGNEITIINTTSKRVDLFPTTGETIADNGTDIAQNIAALNVIQCYCTKNGYWTAKITASNDIPNQLNGTQTNITAYAGGGQANAFQLHRKFSEITIVASMSDSVKLKTAIIGREMFVRNSALNKPDVYPAIGDEFVLLGVNNPLSLADESIAWFVCLKTGVWNYAQL